MDALLSNKLVAAALVVVIVPLVLVGYILLIEFILRRIPRRTGTAIRPWLWLAPALVFLGVFLVYPTIATIVRSFQNRRGDGFVGARELPVVLQPGRDAHRASATTSSG